VNGNLVVEGTKNLNVNAETSHRNSRRDSSIDLDTSNTVLSSRLANMELR